MALQFSRNAKVYIEVEGTLNSPGVNTVWQVPVLDGFSFSQAINTTEVTVSEAGSTSRRAQLIFNDSLAPVEWSFSTYIRPFVSAGTGAGAADDATEVHSVEEALWAMFMGANAYNSTTKVLNRSGSAINTPAGALSTFSFAQSNISAMSDAWNIYFSFEEVGNTQVYRLNQAVVNSATIDFDIEGIATIQWSGFAQAIEDVTTNTPTRDIYEKISDTSVYIRNRISTVSLVRTDVSPDLTYNIVITGGSISFENNISYLTPEELGIVNQPIANVTGTRSIRGTLNCYLDPAATKSGALFANLVADTTTVRNVFDMAINIGGETASTPRLTLDIPTAHVEIPSIGIEDLLTLEIGFAAQPSSGNVDNTDEATIIYRA